MKSALVVAHPDDEVMWFGGLVLSQSDADWTIICCTVPRIDWIRSYKFFDACEALGARGRLLAPQEPPPTEPLTDALMGLLDLEPYDRIVTHGAEGEYGHRHHLSLYDFIHARWGYKEIWSCCPPANLVRAQGFDSQIDLPSDMLARKLAALECYDHVLPYEGVPMPKWQALIKRYVTDGGWDLGTERYRIRQGR